MSSKRGKFPFYLPSVPFFPSFRNWRRWLIGLFTVLALAFIISFPFIPPVDLPQLGERSDEDIRAPKTVRYLDELETKKLKEEATNRVGKVYDFKPQAALEAERDINLVYDEIIKYTRKSSPRSISAKIAALRRALKIKLPREVLALSLSLSLSELKELKNYTKQIVKSVMAKEIRDDAEDLKRANNQIDLLSQRLPIEPTHRFIVTQISKKTLQPNKIYNYPETMRRIEEAVRSVEPAYKQILAGEIVVHKGETVTQEHILKFQALHLQKPTVNFLMVVSLILLVSVLVGLTALYLSKHLPNIYKSNKQLFLLSLVCVLTMFIFWLSSPLSPYLSLLMVAAAGMVISILLNYDLAILSVIFLSLLIGVMVSYEPKIIIPTVISGLVGVLVTSKVCYRKDLISAGLILSLVNSFVILIMNLGHPEEMFWTNFIWGIGSGVFASVLAFGAITFFERLFEITTHMRLLELSNPGEPLLRQMTKEAPGTYQHSIMVGNLAESAAEKIGADALLARVGAYYHDIGKLKRPTFFIENQPDDNNIHDRLSPTLSALAIAAHTKDGLELAKGCKLPAILTDFISQHHGTSLISFFHQQAVMSGDESVSEEQFRYEGPKPQTKEVALVMLADAVEAAARTLRKPSHSRLKMLVSRIVKNRLQDGQLDESDLTFKDLKKVTDSFVQILSSRLHMRIDYPETKEIAEGEPRLGNTHKKPKKAAGKKEFPKQGRPKDLGKGKLSTGDGAEHLSGR